MDPKSELVDLVLAQIKADKELLAAVQHHRAASRKRLDRLIALQSGRRSSR